MNYDKIGKFIQQKRKDKNLTQKQLAEKIGVTDRAISKWERGQGCPDVSILEILSKELGCSILELLKGREIENEVIPVTEADDYVRDSMQLSNKITKEKIVSITNKIIISSIIFILLLLSYLNVMQVVYSTKKHTSEGNRFFYKEYKKKIDLLENNLDIIKNNKGKFSNDDYKYIVEELDKMVGSIKNRKLYSYILDGKDIVYTVNDFYVFSVEEDLINYSEYPLIKKLVEYDDSDYTSNYYDTVSSGRTVTDLSSFYLTTLTSYKYRLKPYDDTRTMYYDENEEIRILLYRTRYDISRMVYLTDIIMKVGEINE